MYDENENEIVRHEAISAYSSITNDIIKMEVLTNDSSRLVRESAIVAIDMINYWS